MPPFTSITLHNFKGGTGKTMFAVHLAHYLIARGQPWTLWDADPQANAMALLTGHRWKGEDTIRIPASGGGADLIATITPEDAFDTGHVIIDTPPAEGIITELAPRLQLGSTDLVVCPAAGRLGIDGAIKVADEVAPIGCRLVVVANMTDPNHWHAREEIEALEELARAEEFDIEVFRMAIPRNEQYLRKAELHGMPVWDIPHARRTYAVQALERFCEWIADGAPEESNVGPRDATRRGARRDLRHKLNQRLWN